VKTREAHDRNIGVYLQDTWRPSTRVTLNLGLRVDTVRRYDGIFKIERQNSTEIQPRVGFSYMVTSDAKNVLRGSYGRFAEQVMGRDAVTLFGAGDVAEARNLYDLDGNGTFETERITPARSATIATSEFDRTLHQPFVDEFVLGFRKQFPWQISLDVSGIRKSYKHMYGRVDINGIYPSAAGQPFGGFGRIDPNRGIVFQQTNNTWSTLEYRGLEITLAKNFAKGFQLLGGFNRQWHHYGGTWNPTDPARFLQPDAFPSQQLLYMPRGNNEDTSLLLNNGTTTHTYGPTWQKYSFRLGGTWKAPRGFLIAASYNQTAGPWSGPVVDFLPVNDPEVTKFGPASVVLANGTTQANPLSTRMRFVRVDCPTPATTGLLRHAREPGAAAGREEPGAEARQDDQARRHARDRGRRQRVQPAQRRQLLAVQLQRREREVQPELPADEEPAVGTRVPAHRRAAVLDHGAGPVSRDETRAHVSKRESGGLLQLIEHRRPRLRAPEAELLCRQAPAPSRHITGRGMSIARFRGQCGRGSRP
jgi:hypothetical protein